MGKRVGLVTVCLLLLAASPPPKPDNGAEDERTAKSIDSAADRIATSIRDTIKPTEKDKGCQGRKDDRQSSLCAQWEATDAAIDAANSAWLAVIFSAIGTGLLVWTLLETRTTTRRELRAYVSVEVKELRCDISTGRVSVAIKVQNHGTTPAFKTCWAGNIYVATPEQFEKDIVATKANRRGNVGRPVETVINASQYADGEINGLPDLSSDDIVKVTSGSGCLCMFCFVFYRDVFGRKRETRFAAIATDLPRPSVDNLNKMIVGQGLWTVPPFFNEAT